MFYILYKTVCLINKKFYVGVHIANTLEDTYLGSGLIIKRSIQKYGRENHIREILELCPSKKILMERECFIIDMFIGDSLCMNIARGGQGGFINSKSAAAGGKKSGKSNLTEARNKRKEKIAFFIKEKVCKICTMSFEVKWKSREKRFCSQKCRSINLSLMQSAGLINSCNIKFLGK